MDSDSPRSELLQGNEREQPPGFDLRALASPEPLARGGGKQTKGSGHVPQLNIPSETFVTQQLTSNSSTKVSFNPDVLKTPGGPPSGPPETWGFQVAEVARVPNAPATASSRVSVHSGVLTRKGLRVGGKKGKVNFDGEDPQLKKEPQTAPAKLRGVSLHDTYTHIELDKRALDWNRLNSRDSTNLFTTQDRIHDALHGVYYAHPNEMDLDQHLARAGLKSPRSRLHTILEIAISCKDLQKRGSGLEPDPLCKIFCKGLLSKRWIEVFCTDWRAREQSPNFAKILRIGVPDNCGAVRFVVYDKDHKKRNSDMVQIGLLECTLQREVLEACAKSPAFTAALRDVQFEATAANGIAEHNLDVPTPGDPDGEGAKQNEQLGPDGGRDCGTMTLKVDVLQDPAILSSRLRHGLDFPGSKPPDSSTQMSSSQKYIPKFQRGLQQLQVLAMDLFHQFKLIDARGDVLPKDKVNKGISSEQFVNLLIYAGVLQAVQAGLVSSVLDWEGRIGALTIEEARNIHRSVIGRPKSGGLIVQGDLLTKELFAECLKRVMALLHEKHDKARDNAIKNGEAADSRPSTPGVGVLRTYSNTAMQPQPPTDGAPGFAHQDGGRRLKGASAGASALRTPLGSFRRLSSRRAGRETLRTRLGIVDGEGYPSGSLTARSSAQSNTALGTPRPLTSRSQTWGRANLEPLEVDATRIGSGEWPRPPHTAGGGGNARNGTLKVREFGKLLDVAAWSPDRHIQSQAAPAIAALALSSGSNSRVVQSFGAVKVMMDLFATTDIAQVKADCMDAISQMVRSNIVACRQFVQEGGLGLTLRSTKEDVIVRRRCLQVLESVLVESEADIGDRYSHRILLGLCALVAAPPQDLQEKAARLLVRMTKNATAKAQVWEPLREVEVEEVWIAAEGVLGEKMKRNAIRALCHLLAAAKSKYTDLSKPSLYPSKLYDSRDYSSASLHSVGNALLNFFWALESPSNDSHKQCVGLFIAQGLCDVLAKRLAQRTDGHLMEEDVTCLRCLTRLVTAVTDGGGTNGVMPPEAQAAAREILPKRQTVPFKWMTPEQIASLAETARYRYLNANDTVVRQGEDGTSCFLVLSGNIKVLRRIRSETHELAVLTRGSEYGSASLLLHQARSATLMASTPCEVMEIATSDLVCVAREQDSLALFGKMLDYMEQSNTEEMRVPRIEIQRSMGRKAMASMALAQERIKQVLLESVSSLGKFEEPLKQDLEIQNLSCVLAHTTASRTPYAIQVWNAGLPIPILSLTSSPEASVARRACEVIAALCNSKQVCEALSPFPNAHRKRSQEPSSTSDASSPRTGIVSASATPTGSLSPLATIPASGASVQRHRQPVDSALPPELLIDCIIRGLSVHGDVSLLSALASLLQHPGVRPLVFARCPPTQLLPIIQGASPSADNSFIRAPSTAGQASAAAHGPSNETPEHLLFTIRALLGLGEEREGRLLIQSREVTRWLDEHMSRMESADRELVQAYSRFISLVNSSAGPSTPVGGVKSKFFSRNSNAFKSMAVLSHSFGKPRAGSADEGSAGGDGAEEYKGAALSSWAQQQQQTMKPLEELDEKAQAKEALAQKRKQIARLMQIAQKQAEEEWQSNVQWVLHGKQPRRGQQTDRLTLSQLDRIQTAPAGHDLPRGPDNQVGVHQAILGMQEQDIAEMTPEMAPFIRRVQVAVASFDMAEHQRQKERALKRELEEKKKTKYKGPDLTSAIKARRHRAVAQLRGKQSGTDTTSDSDGGAKPGTDSESTPRTRRSPANARQSDSDSGQGGAEAGGEQLQKTKSGVWDAVAHVSVEEMVMSHAKLKEPTKHAVTDNDMWKYGTILAEAAQSMLSLHKSASSPMPKARFKAAARAALCMDRICRLGSPAFLQASHLLLRIEAENKAKAAGAK